MLICIFYRAAKGKQAREASKTPSKSRKGAKSQSNTPAKGKEKKPQSPKKARAARAAKPKPAPKQKNKPPEVKEESIEEVCKSPTLGATKLVAGAIHISSKHVVIDDLYHTRPLCGQKELVTFVGSTKQFKAY